MTDITDVRVAANVLEASLSHRPWFIGVAVEWDDFEPTLVVTVLPRRKISLERDVPPEFCGYGVVVRTLELPT